jgi:hypothetical protein
LGDHQVENFGRGHSAIQHVQQVIASEPNLFRHEHELMNRGDQARFTTISGGAIPNQGLPAEWAKFGTGQNSHNRLTKSMTRSAGLYSVLKVGGFFPKMLHLAGGEVKWMLTKVTDPRTNSALAIVAPTH